MTDLRKRLDVSDEVALARVPEALKAERFGVLRCAPTADSRIPASQPSPSRSG
jgi:hypothetical protein